MSMRRSLWFACALLCASPLAEAATPSVTIGVFLPTSIGEGQGRYDFGQKLAAALSKSLGTTVTAQNFAKYGDFLAAINQHKISLGVVDGWIAAQMSDRIKVVAAAVVKGETRQRWMVVSREGRSVPSLQGKRLAVARGTGQEVSFINNAIFDGNLAADKHFKFTFVPAIESGTKMYEVRSVDAVLLPESLVPAKASVVYRSSPIPIATVVAAAGARPELLTAIEGIGAVGPFDRFVTTDLGDLANLKRLISKGPPPRVPLLASAPPLRPDTHALVTFRGIPTALPAFLDYLPSSKELPDD